MQEVPMVEREEVGDVCVICLLCVCVCVCVGGGGGGGGGGAIVFSIFPQASSSLLHCMIFGAHSK